MSIITIIQNSSHYKCNVLQGKESTAVLTVSQIDTQYVTPRCRLCYRSLGEALLDKGLGRAWEFMI